MVVSADKEKRFVYQTQVSWKGEKRGELSSVGFPSIEVATPPEFGGHKDVWTPEHLFVASMEVCLLTTFLHFAKKLKVYFISYTSKAEGVLQAGTAKLAFRMITVRPRIVVADEAMKDRAQRALDMAKTYCLISESMKTEVKVEPEILVQ